MRICSEHPGAEAGALARLLERGFVAIQSCYEAVLALALRRATTTDTATTPVNVSTFRAAVVQRCTSHPAATFSPRRTIFASRADASETRRSGISGQRRQVAVAFSMTCREVGMTGCNRLDLPDRLHAISPFPMAAAIDLQAWRP
jgi:hypothetical protein